MHNDSFSFFDFDNTIYKGQSRYLILDFAIFLEKAGRFNSAELEIIRTLFSSYYQGIINRHEFGIQVVESYYRGLSTAPEKEINAYAKLFWNDVQTDAWFSYTIPLLKILNKATTSILISGSPIEILEIINHTLGFTRIYASKGLIQNGVYTGHTLEEMATFQAKAQLMRNLSDTLAFNPATSFAFGDSESDYPLLQSVDPKNAYLLGPGKGMENPESDKRWNFLEVDKEILDSVSARIHKLFP